MKWRYVTYAFQHLPPSHVSSSEDHLVGCYSGAVHKVCLNSQILEAGQGSSYYICLASINLIQWMCLLLFSEFNTLHLVVWLYRTIILGGGGGTMICRQVAHSCFVGHKHDRRECYILFGNTCCSEPSCRSWHLFTQYGGSCMPLRLFPWLSHKVVQITWKKRATGCRLQHIPHSILRSASSKMDRNICLCLQNEVNLE